MFTIIVPLLVGSVVHAETALSSAQTFFRREVAPLIAATDGRARGRVVRAGRDRAEIRLSTPGYADYVIAVDAARSHVPAGAPDVTVTPKFKLAGALELPIDWASENDAAGNQLRQLLRSDPFLHPMNHPAAAFGPLTPPQREIYDQLHVQRREAVARGEAQRSLVWLPPGLGKGLVARTFAESLGTPEAPALVLYILNQYEGLDQFVEKYQAGAGLTERQIRKVYGANSALDLYAPGVRLVATTRIGAYAKLEKFFADAVLHPGPIVVITDEAGRIGKSNGQFAKILDILKVSLSPRDALVGLSATPWHTDVGPIHPIFDNHLATAFASREEIESYVRAGRLLEFAVLIYFRAMQAGYASAIYEYRHVTHYGPHGDQPTRAFLNDTDVEHGKAAPTFERDLFRRNLRVHRPFLKEVLRDIRRTVQKVNGVPAYWNRSVMFVPSIAHAEEYAKILNRLARPADRLEVVAYHSEIDGRKKILDWFETPGGGHKCLLVVETIGDAYDLRSINHIMLARAYSAFDPVGMGRLIQHLGRATRVGAGKNKLFITDFTGDLARLVLRRLDPSLLRNVFVKELPPPTAEELAPLREVVVREDDETLKKARVARRNVDVPVESLAEADRKADADHANWTLARVLVDTDLVRRLIPDKQLAQLTLRWVTLADHLARRLTAQPRAADRSNEAAIDAALGLFGLRPEQIAARGETAVFEAALRQDRFGLKARRWDLTKADRKPALVARLIELDPLFGELTRVRTEDLTAKRTIYDRGRLSPRANSDEEGIWTAPWTTAELLLNPLIPDLFAIPAAENLGQLLLGTARVDDATVPAAWRPVDSATLARASDWGLLTVDARRYVYDAKYRQRLIEDLITLDPEVFGAPAPWSDLHLLLRARAAKFSRAIATFARAYLFLKGRDTRVALRLPRPDIGAPRPSLGPQRSDAPNAAAWTRRWYGSGAAARSGWAKHGTHYETLANVELPWILKSLDDEAHAALSRYLRTLGPLPTPVRQTEARPVDDVEYTTGDWTLAHFLTSTRALRVFTPAPFFHDHSFRANFGQYICAAVTGFAPDDQVAAVTEILIGLGLDLPSWRARGWDGLIARACREEFFLRSRGTRWSRATDGAEERALIELAPAVFGARVRFGGDEAADRTSAFLRGTIVPSLAPPPTTVKWSDRWTVAKVLLDPLAGRYLTKGYGTVAEYLLRNFGQNRLGDSTIETSRSWSDLLTPALAAAVARGVLRECDRNLCTEAQLNAAIKRLIQFRPDLFGQTVGFTHAELLAHAKLSSYRKARKRGVEWLLWRLGLDVSAPPSTPNRRIAMGQLTAPTDAGFTADAWVGHWTVARVLINPLAALVLDSSWLKFDERASLGRALTEPDQDGKFGVEKLSQAYHLSPHCHLLYELRIDRMFAAREQGLFDAATDAGREDDLRAAEQALIDFEPSFAKPVTGFEDAALATKLLTGDARTNAVTRARIMDYLRARASVPPGACESALLDP